MKVCNMLQRAKQNDPDAIYCLNKYYEVIFSDFVRKRYGDNAAERAIEALPSLINKYLLGDMSLSLDSFLRIEAENFKEQTDCITSERKTILIGDKIDIDNKEQKEYIIEHYAQSFYKKIKRYSTLVGEYNLKRFCLQFVKELYHKKIYSNNDIRNVMCSYIKKEVDNYYLDEEKLLKRYVMFLGINHSILNYFYNKYLYLLNEYKYNGQYKGLKLNYRNIVLTSLLSIVKTSTNISVVIRRNLHKEYRKLKENEKQEISLIRSGSSKNRDQIIENYSYFKELIYNRVKSLKLFDESVLKTDIEKKYTDFINAYLNGKSQNDISRYLNFRLSEWIKEYILKAQKDNTYHSYLFYVDKYLEKLSPELFNDVSKEKLLITYDEVFKKYYEKERKTPIAFLIRKSLKDEVDKINNTYVDSNADDINLSYKVSEEKETSKKEV